MRNKINQVTKKSYDKLIEFKMLSILFLFFTSVSVFAQNVGVNTVDPRKTLEVAGDMNVSNRIEIQTIENVQDADQTALLQQQANGVIASLDLANSPTAAMAYVQEYRIENMQQDWIRDFDTNIDATDYVVVVVSAFYNQSLIMDINQSNYFAMQICTSFISGGTWHIEADYPVANNNTGNTQIGVWEITTLIYPRNLTKQLGATEYPLSGNTTGVASPPVLD